jgi:hypothetical protein
MTSHLADKFLMLKPNIVNTKTQRAPFRMVLSRLNNTVWDSTLKGESGLFRPWGLKIQTQSA